MCEQARRGGRHRTQDCLAISGDGRSWYLVNASPDLRTQLGATPELRPGPGRRQTPIRGVLLSTAELDHCLGLLTLREADNLRILSTATVRHALTDGFPMKAALASYADVDWRVLARGESVRLDGGLEVLATVVGSKRPRYAAGEVGDEWAVAYTFTDDRGGGTLVYASCLPALDDATLDVVTAGDCVLVDGTFFQATEMTSRAGSDQSAQTRMGHVPITVSLPLLAGRPGPRYLYTHLNNTNPATAEDSQERRTIVASGADVASDGQLLAL